MERRTNWDFSKHTHIVEIFKSEEGSEIRVDHFRKGDSNQGYVKFVNDDRGLSVFGDFGNWIFCRPFHPAPDNFVSDGYWNEKLKMHSSQDHARYNEEETTKEIHELINSGLKEYGYEGEELELLKEWLRDLLPYVSSEIEYAYHAYYCGNPVNMDYEMIPFCKEGSNQLKIVFDAFDEICSRLKTEQNGK